jgi:PAS domain S-box-containing protein
MYILIVEDDPGTGEYIKSSLQRYGRSISVVKSSDEAQRILFSRKVDLMILDYRLPGTTAASFITELKAQDCRVPTFIVTTGQGDERTAVEMMKLGASDYLIKDLNFTEFLPEVVAKTIASIEREEKLGLSEKKLKESEERFRQYSNMLPECIFETDKDLNLVFASEAGLKMFGLDADELKEMHLYDFIPEDQRAKSQDIIKRRFQGENVPANEFTAYRKDGTVLQVLVNSYPIVENGQFAGIRGIIIDISENKKVEAELRDREENLRITLNSIGDAVITTDKSGVIRRMNPIAEQLTGYSHTEAEGKKLKQVFNIVNAETEVSCPSPVEKVLEKGEIVGLANHTTLISKTGVKHQIADSASPIRNSSGEIIGVVLAFRDVTEEYALQQRIRESEQQYRGIFENTAIGIGMRSAKDGSYIKFNKYYMQMLGYSEEELRGMKMKDITHPDDCEQSDRLFSDVAGNSSKSETYKKRYIRKDGSVMWADVSITGLTDEKGEVYATIGVVSNVTEREKATEKLELSRKKFKNIFESISNGIIYLDFSGTVVDANPAVESILSISKPELKGQNAFVIIKNLLSEQYVAEITGKVRRVLEAGERTSFRVPYEDKIVSVRMRPDVSAQRITCVVDDITEQTKYQNEIEEYNKELQKAAEALKASNAELENAKLKAEESDRLKSAFLANMSHEIRTPMNSIIGFSEILKSEAQSGKSVVQYADIIIKSSNYLLSLINDIIDISKIDAGKVNVLLEPTDINSVLSELRTVYQSRINNAGQDVDLILDVPEPSCTIRTDETRLRQILTNLADNAVKFTHNGEIRIGYEIQGDRIEFFVQDSGIGIPKEKHNAIFERFTQAADTTEKLYGGTGLGLAIVRACVEMLGGNITLESEENKGTKFIFDLPYSPVKTGGSGEELNSGNSIIFNNEHILVAEDNSETQMYIKSVFESYDVRISTVENGEKAIEFVMNNPDVKLILMDIQMPIMTGLEATVALREKGIDIPIIAQTAYAFDEDKEKSFKAGCDNHLAKPVKPALLISIVQKHLQLYDLASSGFIS